MNDDKFSSRVEHKLDKLSDNLNSELRLIHTKLTHLEAINSNHDSRSLNNTEEIEKLKTKMHQAEGAIKFGKWLCVLFIGYIISFGIWVNTTIHEIKRLID